MPVMNKISIRFIFVLTCMYEKLIEDKIFRFTVYFLFILSSLSSVSYSCFRYLSSNVLPIATSKEIIGKNFLLAVLSSTNLHNPLNRLYILYQFLLKRPLLNAGGILLPYLVFFNSWIHDNISFKMTQKEAKEARFREHLDMYLLNHFPMSRQKLLNQFDNMKGKCANY